MDEQRIPLTELLPVIREVLAMGGEFSLMPRGKSMRPYLREGRDSIILSAITEPPKRGDILLYVRDTGVPVLHRVIRVDADGTLSMRGDNQYFIESGIRREQCVAIMKRFYKKGREKKVDAFPSRLYRAWRTTTYLPRRVFFAVVRRAKRLWKGETYHG